MKFISLESGMAELLRRIILTTKKKRADAAVLVMVPKKADSDFGQNSTHISAETEVAS